MTATIERPTATVPTFDKPRAAARIERGWHVEVHGRWLLVDCVVLAGGRVHLTAADGTAVSPWRTDVLPTRDPAEQFAYIAALLPTLGCYKPQGVHSAGPMANPYTGSGKTSILGAGE